MGQIIGLNAKCKRANLNALSLVPTPANGEIILVSSDNNMAADGQGIFDAYVVGNGTTAATALELHYLSKDENNEILEDCYKVIKGNITEVGITSSDLINANIGFKDSTKRITIARNSLIPVGNIGELFSIKLHVSYSAVSTDPNIDRVNICFYNSSKMFITELDAGWQYFGNSDVDIEIDPSSSQYSGVAYIGLLMGSKSADINASSVDATGITFSFAEKSSVIIKAVNVNDFEEYSSKTDGKINTLNDVIYSNNASEKSITQEDAITENLIDVFASNGTTVRRAYFLDVSSLENYTFNIVTINCPFDVYVEGWMSKTIDTQVYVSSKLVNGTQFTINKENMENCNYVVIRFMTNALNFDSFLRIAEWTLSYFEQKGMLSRINALEDIVSGGSDGASLMSYNGEQILINSNECSYKEMGRLQTSGDNQTVQGGAVYGNYLFQFYNTLGRICVYDLSTKTDVDIIKLTPNPDCHANSGGFSSAFYDSSDTFPLLYVSSQNEKRVYVYRITGAIGALSCALVQTITLDTEYYFVDITIDPKRNKIVLYGYTKNSWTSSSNNNIVTMSCDIPSYSGDVTISSFENVSTLNYIYATQGAFAKNGKLYLSYGNTTQPAGGGIYVIDYIAGIIKSHIDLSQIGELEPEACCQWGDSIVFTSSQSRIYRLNF